MLEFLTSDSDTPTLLEALIERGICFTTVLNASELMFLTSNTEEEAVVKTLLSGINVLGIHARYSLSVPAVAGTTDSVREAVIASVAINNRLPVATYAGKSYVKSGITVITE